MLGYAVIYFSKGAHQNNNRHSLLVLERLLVLEAFVQSFRSLL